MGPFWPVEVGSGVGVVVEEEEEVDMLAAGSSRRHGYVCLSDSAARFFLVSVSAPSSSIFYFLSTERHQR